MTTSITTRFAEVHSYSGLSMRKFADVIGISQPSAKAILDGDNAPSFKAIDGLLIGFPQISAEWLLRGKGSMLLTTSTELSEGRKRFQEVATPSDTLRARFHEGEKQYLDRLIEEKIEEALKKKGIG